MRGRSAHRAGRSGLLRGLGSRTGVDLMVKGKEVSSKYTMDLGNFMNGY